MRYEVKDIVDGVAFVEFEDGSTARVALRAAMTQTEVDAAIADFAPKTYAAPAFLTVGYVGTAVIAAPADQLPDLSPADTSMDWFKARTEAYGPVEAQLEYITEHGLAAWQAYVAEVKAANPKT